MCFRFKYFFFTAVLFIVEAFIGMYMHDSIIRPFGGDMLVVVLLYCFVRAFFKVNVMPAVKIVLITAYAVEISQHFHLINVLGLQDSLIARLVLGTTFSWMDMLMYTLGIILVVVAEVFLEFRTEMSK